MRIETVSLGAWTSGTPSERRRAVALDVVVERVFRGPLRTGERLKIEAEQHEPIGRYFAVTGAWSGKTLERGSKYIVFSRSAAETLRVTYASEATDIELALGFEDNGWALSELARRAGPQKASLGPLFAEYLNVKLPGAVSGGVQQWDSILSFFEAPGLAPRFRVLAATAAMDAVLMLSPAPDHIVRRTAVMAFRLLSMQDENGFHERLVGTYLPTLLGQHGAEPKRSAAEIFADYPRDRERAARSLSAAPPYNSRAFLQNWLAR
jgi:hypothetical protein